MHGGRRRRRRRKNTKTPKKQSKTNQPTKNTRELTRRSKDDTQAQQQRPKSPTVILTWHVCKYRVHKLHQRYVLTDVTTTTTTKRKEKKKRKRERNENESPSITGLAARTASVAGKTDFSSAKSTWISQGTSHLKQEIKPSYQTPHDWRTSAGDGGEGATEQRLMNLSVTELSSIKRLCQIPRDVNLCGYSLCMKSVAVKRHREIWAGDKLSSFLLRQLYFQIHANR